LVPEPFVSERVFGDAEYRCAICPGIPAFALEKHPRVGRGVGRYD
jgi:hypothetical protein